MDDHVILLPSQILALSKSQPSNQRQSYRRERPRRSSPLAGPSYSADNVGNLIEHSSALEQEIERRRLDSGLPTPPISRQVSVDSRRARPSFISLAPSRDSLIPPSPTLRSCHSSPNIVIHPSLSQSSASLPGTDWMTAPSPAFSLPATHSSGALLHVEQDSAGKRARHKSLPSISKSAPQNSNGQNKSESVRSRSLKRFRSVGRLFKHDRDETEVPPLPLDPGTEGPATPPKDAKPETPVPEENKDRGRVRKLWAKVLGGAKRRRG